MTAKKQIFFLFLAIICLVSLSGALVYYFYALNWPGIILSLLSAGSGTYFFAKKLNIKIQNTKYKIQNTSFFILPSIYLLLLIFNFSFLIHSRTDLALTSPWQVVPATFFYSYTLATIALLFLIIKNSKNSIIFICLHYFLSFSVLWIVFKIGYGYDPFIHQATESLIAKQGFVDPKPLYYLGQYSLIVITHKLFFIPIVWLDKLLLPILAAFTLPPAIYLFLKKTEIASSPTLLAMTALFLLILPFSLFALTVPQSLAYLFLLLTILIGLAAKEKIEFILTSLLAVATFFIHPISGLPAILFACLLFIKASNFKLGIKKIFLLAIIIATIILPPLSFYFTAKNNSANTGNNISQNNFTLPAIFWPHKENLILNSTAFFQNNEWLILWILVLASLCFIFIYRRKHPKLIIPASLAISSFLAYLITRQMNFNFLINYERLDYANRILINAFIFLLPIIAVFFSESLTKILKQNNFIKFSWLAFIILMITASLYGSYPRKDNYLTAHSISVGATDLQAVNWIERDAQGKPYVVLANQQVSVSALWTLGFNHYLTSNVHSGKSLLKSFLDSLIMRFCL